MSIILATLMRIVSIISKSIDLKRSRRTRLQVDEGTVNRWEVMRNMESSHDATLAHIGLRA